MAVPRSDARRSACLAIPSAISADANRGTSGPKYVPLPTSTRPMDFRALSPCRLWGSCALACCIFAFSTTLALLGFVAIACSSSTYRRKLAAAVPDVCPMMPVRTISGTSSYRKKARRANSAAWSGVCPFSSCASKAACLNDTSTASAVRVQNDLSNGSSSRLTAPATGPSAALRASLSRSPARLPTRPASTAVYPRPSCSPKSLSCLPL